MENPLRRAVLQYSRGGDKEELIDALVAIAAVERDTGLPAEGNAIAAPDLAWCTESVTAARPRPRRPAVDRLPAGGDEQQISEALTHFDRRYRFPICGLLRRDHPGLSAEGLAEVWQDTMVVISRRAMHRRLHPEASLAQQAWAVARRRTRELVCGDVSGQKHAFHLAGNAEYPELDRRWEILTGLQQEEVLELTCLALARLPKRDKDAWKQHLQSVAADISDSDALAAVCLWEDSPEPAALVPPASHRLDDFRQGVREFLRRKGYNLFDCQGPDADLSDAALVPEKYLATASDPLDRLVLEAMRVVAIQETEPLPDLTETSQYLTAEDCRSLDLLGPDGAQRARAEYPTLRTWSSALWSDHYSRRETCLPTRTVFHSEYDDRRPLKELVRAYHKILRQKRVDWSPMSRFTALLGEGGQGVVYLLRSPGTDGFTNLHALKIFAPDPYVSRGGYVADMRRMARMASIIDNIHCQNVLNVLRFEQQEGVRMMLMEWIDGYDLCQLMAPEILERTRRRIDRLRWDKMNQVVVTEGSDQLMLRPGVAVAIVRHCLTALKHLHQRGIVHGDIKPSNIMLQRNGNAKLIDIGSAFAWNESPQSYHCTFQYAAPEVLAEEAYTPQSDLASLGYVLIELLSGRNLFGKYESPDDLRLAKESLPGQLPTLLPRDVQECPRLVTLCRRLIEPDLDQRYRSAHDADLDHDHGAHAFLDHLARYRLSTAYDHELFLWLQTLGKTLGQPTSAAGSERVS
jgi:serine/threonine-protein kinase